MAESVKKTTKPRAKSKPKAPAKPPTSAAATNGSGAHSNGKEMKLSHEQVAQLAHRFWAERGHKHGHHEEDWFRAEQELRHRAS